MVWKPWVKKRLRQCVSNGGATQKAQLARPALGCFIREAVQIGGVYTPPALRGQGYARAVVAASLLAARSQGAHLATLFTGVQNLAAQRAYEALGFQVVGDYRLVTFRTPLSISPE
jgi:ribosomal protein S18 acetylase RimI-like enzyme